MMTLHPTKDVMKSGGFQAGYYYNWLIGPIGTCVNYNTLSNSPSFYINIGLSF